MDQAFWLPIITVWLTNVAAIISPGPSFVVTARTAVADSRRNGVFCAIGIGLGTLIWTVAALFGIAILFRVVPEAFLVLKFCGAAYLIWLAYKLWRHATDPLVAISGEASEHRSAVASLLIGLGVQVSNPKAAIFFGTIFLSLLPAEPPLAMMVIVVSLATLSEALWFSLVAIALSTPRMRASYRRAKRWIDRATGLVLGGIGLKLALDP